MHIVDTDSLFSMEVINLCGGTRLGCMSGLELDVAQTPPCVLFLIVPADRGGSLLSFRKRDVYRIPWCRVECVGEDTILVKLTPSELAECRTNSSVRKNRQGNL